MAGKKKTAKKSAAAKAPTKSEIFSHISTQTELTKKEVASVFDSLAGMIKKNVGKRGPGVFTIPGLMKITIRTRPATAARKGINPFTGEPTTFKAKPARRVVKVTALKGLKEMA
ncbi:MAG: HU family DNA-binding protein [Xanthomonadaceae bacterium]|nr:HU family DNA-binding protein [Xanthomonadaceae bacterium]